MTSVYRQVGRRVKGHEMRSRNGPPARSTAVPGPGPAPVTIPENRPSYDTRRTRCLDHLQPDVRGRCADWTNSTVVVTSPERSRLGRRLDRDALARPVLDVARDLLGCRIARGGVVVRITETEAYAGGTDPASTVLGRPTPHNAPVFGPAGHAFVYFTYGHHWMLCVVTDGPGVPNVVLVRAAEAVSGQDLVAARRGTARPRDWCRGPGRLTQALGVSGSDSGADLCADDSGDDSGDDGAGSSHGDELSLWAPASDERPPVLTGPRVGVRGPGGDGTAYPWRFWLEGEPTVSPYRRAAPRPPARPGRGT